MRALLAVAGLALVLAGCSSTPPSGEFVADRDNIVTNGSVSVQFQAEQQPYPDPALCPPDLPIIPEDQRCHDAETTVSAHFMTLREPSPEGYTLYWVATDGTEVEIGQLMANGTEMFDLPSTTFNADHSSFPAIELRMGDLVVGTANNQDGATFTPNSALTALSVSGTYKGRDLTVTVSGASPDAAYTGFLYEELENGTVEPVENFVIVGDGEHVFRAQRNIADYAEFHVHVAGSKLNVAQASIE